MNNHILIEKNNNILDIKYIIVQGDTTTAAGCAYAAFLNNITVVHNEAGLRTYNNKHPYPEELNRRFITSFSDIHLAPTLTNKNNWGRLETMTIAYGHGFAITPLHLANAYASLVNGGFKINPSLIRGENRSLLKEKILKNSTSIYVRELLNAVITETNYTGPRVKIEGYEIGGKTGTAELIDKTGRYLDDANRTTFASVFPISNPKYALIAIINTRTLTSCLSI